jgi:hypothetical protein
MVYLRIMLIGDGQRLQRLHLRLKDGWKIFHTKIIDVCGLCYWNRNGAIEAHNDSNEKRDREGRTRNIAGAINLAFYQPENCYLRRTDTKEELPFENCTGFWFDNGVDHEALNSSNENRFHFIMHGGFNKEREELMKRSLVKQFGKDVLREINE